MKIIYENEIDEYMQRQEILELKMVQKLTKRRG